MGGLVEEQLHGAWGGHGDACAVGGDPVDSRVGVVDVAERALPVVGVDPVVEGAQFGEVVHVGHSPVAPGIDVVGLGGLCGVFAVGKRTSRAE